jgi:pyrroline-5-carboxylate reductase
MSKVGFIGAGNMGYAMMEGLVSQEGIEGICFTDVSEERKIFTVQKLGIQACGNNTQVCAEAKYIILGIKPQYMQEVMKEIAPSLTPEHIMISVAPGITIEQMKEYMGNVKIVRTMPNTPALVGCGMSAVSFCGNVYTKEEQDSVISIFRSFGEVEVLEERFMDAVVPLSGSSPAYVYMFIEAMADAGVRMGMPRKTAYFMAAQSVLGSAKMVLETGQHPGVLKDAVCSPGGTTIEAVAALEKHGFRNAIMEAMRACYEKAKKIGI